MISSIGFRSSILPYIQPRTISYYLGNYPEYLLDDLNFLYESNYLQLICPLVIGSIYWLALLTNQCLFIHHPGHPNRSTLSKVLSHFRKAKRILLPSLRMYIVQYELQFILLNPLFTIFCQ